MSNASSVNPFSPSSAAASSSASLASNSSAPSTGLGARAVTLVPVLFTPQGGVVLRQSEPQMAGQQQQFRDAPSSPAALDVKSAHPPGSDLLSQKGLQTEHPYLDRLLQAFRPRDVPIRPPQKFSGATSISRKPTLEGALKELKRQAMEIGFSGEKIRSWLTSDNTLIRLIEKETWWLCEIPEGTGSDAVALNFVERGYGFTLVPAHLRSYRVCLEATSGHRSSPFNLVNVPPEHRTPELFRAAVRKDPDAINHLKPNERTIDLYELVGESLGEVDLLTDTFSRLCVSKEMEANDRYQAVVDRLRERKNALILEAWLKDPYAAINSFALHRTELTLDMYALVGAKVDLGTFSRLYVSKEMAEKPRFKTVLAQLQKEAQSGLHNRDWPRQGDGKRAEAASRMEWDYGDGNGGGGRPTHAAPSRAAVPSASYASSTGLRAPRRRGDGQGESSS